MAATRHMPMWMVSGRASRRSDEMARMATNSVMGAYALRIENAPRIEKAEMTSRRQRFEFAAEQEPAEVALDPNTWVLMQAAFSKH